MFLVNKLFFTFFILLMAASATMPQERVICGYCKKAINQSYIKVDDNYFHQDHFLCAGCGKVITGSYNKFEGEYYHPECYADKTGLICAYCGKRITGEYLHSGGKPYHPDCFKDNVLAKCAVCSKPLDSEYYINSYDEKYHAFHASEFKECDNCGRLICPALTHGGRTYSDGRNMCNICYSNAVFKDYEMNELLSEVMASLTRLGLNFRKEAIRIKAVDLAELQKVSKNRLPHKGMRGYCNTETNTQYLNGREVKSVTKHTIFVLNGLPALATQAVIAHELMHSWIYENTPHNFPDDINEGSCNFIAYCYLKTKISPEIKPMITRMEQNPDAAYGGGFLKIRTEFEDAELEEFLSYLRNASK